MVDEDKQPLMGSYNEAGLPALPDFKLTLVKKWERVSSQSKFMIHCATITFYTVLFLVIFFASNRQSQDVPCPQPIITSTKVEYQSKVSPNFLHSEYAGRNHHEIDLKWHDLLDNISLRATDEEIAKNRNHPSSISLPEGGGQLVWMEVSHHLHCVKMLRQWSYREVYFATADEMTILKMSRHIEMLRQVLMCRPDTSLTTFLWVNSQDKPILNIEPFERECVDWDVMIESVKDRVVSLEEVEGLINPLHVAGTQNTEDVHISLPLASSPIE